MGLKKGLPWQAEDWGPCSEGGRQSGQASEGERGRIRAGAEPSLNRGPEWGATAVPGPRALASRHCRELSGAGRAEQHLNPGVLPTLQTFLSHLLPLRLLTMTQLSAQVKGSLNITKPGVQIWRIEVRSAWVWGGGED